MPERKGFDLGDYVEVKDRIARFYEFFGQGRLVTEEVQLTSEPDGKPRVLVRAAAYRTADDPHPGVGWSWMELPGTTSYTKGSELENTETSAWGRAIAALGILVDHSIASAQEVRNKDGEASAPKPVVDADREGLIGTAQIGKARDSDFELRQEPDGGYAIGFALVSSAGKIKATATSPLAEEIKAYQEHIVGQRVTAFGRIRDESFRPTGSQKTVTYQVLELTGLRVPEVGDLPAPTPEQGEAVTAPLFSEDEQSRIDAALDARVPV